MFSTRCSKRLSQRKLRLLFVMILTLCAVIFTGCSGKTETNGRNRNSRENNALNDSRDYIDNGGEHYETDIKRIS